jgi:hypothetical protein
VSSADKALIKEGDTEAIGRYISAITKSLEGNTPVLLDLPSGTTITIPSTSGSSVIIPAGKELVVGEGVKLDLSAGAGTVKLDGGKITIPNAAIIEIQVGVDYFGTEGKG